MKPAKRKAYTTQCLTKAVTRRKSITGQDQYFKDKLLPWEVDNFIKLQKLGIGIEIKSHKRSQKGVDRGGWVTAQPGITVAEIMDTKMDHLYKYIPDQLTKIRKVLRENELAHCDIKPENVVLRGHKLLLIDNDHVSEFGWIPRPCGHIGYNCAGDPANEEVTEHTDDMGFDRMINQVKALIRGEDIPPRYGSSSVVVPLKSAKRFQNASQPGLVIQQADYSDESQEDRISDAESERYDAYYPQNTNRFGGTHKFEEPQKKSYPNLSPTVSKKETYKFQPKKKSYPDLYPPVSKKQCCCQCCIY